MLAILAVFKILESIMCDSKYPARLGACVGTGPIVSVFEHLPISLGIFCISWSLFWIVKTSRTPFPEDMKKQFISY